jgi:hypothetical protein
MNIKGLLQIHNISGKNRKKNTLPTHRMNLAFWYPYIELQGFATRCYSGSNASLFACIMARIISMRMVCKNLP